MTKVRLEPSVVGSNEVLLVYNSFLFRNVNNSKLTKTAVAKPNRLHRDSVQTARPRSLSAKTLTVR